jgi:hypothetical protein
MFDAHTRRLLSSRARDRLGSRIEINNAMMAITTNSSIRVNALGFRLIVSSPHYLETHPRVAALPRPVRPEKPTGTPNVYGTLAESPSYDRPQHPRFQTSLNTRQTARHADPRRIAHPATPI